MGGFTFTPEAPAKEAFDGAAPAGDAITTNQLVNTPLNKWDAVVESGGPPSDLADLRRNLFHELKQSSRATSHLNEGYVGKIARGGFDKTINRDGIDKFAERQTPYPVKLDGYKELHQEIYGEAQKLNEQGLPPEQLENAIDQLMEYKDGQLEKLGNDYESQINKTLDTLANPPAQVPPEQGVKPVVHAI